MVITPEVQEKCSKGVKKSKRLKPLRKKSELEKEFIDKIPDEMVRSIFERKHEAMLQITSGEIKNSELFVNSLMKEIKEMKKSE